MEKENLEKEKSVLMGPRRIKTIKMELWKSLLAERSTDASGLQRPRNEPFLQTMEQLLKKEKKKKRFTVCILWPIDYSVFIPR